MAQGVEDQDHGQRNPAPEAFQSSGRCRDPLRKHGRPRQNGFHLLPSERDPISSGVQQKEGRQPGGGDPDRVDQVERGEQRLGDRKQAINHRLARSRLQKWIPRSGHDEGRRSRKSAVPHRPHSQVGADDENSDVRLRIVTAEEGNKEGAADDAEGPVEVSGDQREQARKEHGLKRPLGVGNPGDAIQQPVDRPR